MSNYASKRKFSAVSSENILRMEGANSCVYSGGDIVGRISDNTGISEGHDSFVSRLSRSSYATNTTTTMGLSSAHTSVINIFQMLSSAEEGTLYFINHGRPEVNSEVLTKELDSQNLDNYLEILGRTHIYETYLGTLDSIIQDLSDSYKSAVTGSESNDWLEAINQELSSLVDLILGQ